MSDLMIPWVILLGVMGGVLGACATLMIVHQSAKGDISMWFDKARLYEIHQDHILMKKQIRTLQLDIQDLMSEEISGDHK